MGEFCTRPERLACYILDEKTTIRKTALAFGISKSTVHNDLSKRLKHINFSLYKKVKKLLNTNFEERHIRGGEATKQKYLISAKCSQKQNKKV